MIRHSDQLRRRYMDDTVYRSATTSPMGYSDLVDTRAPRYSPSLGFDERRRTGYLDRGLGNVFGNRSSSSSDRDFYGFEGEGQLGSNELIRRTNREVAVANGAITQASPNVQLHPMMTAEGRYPVNFTVPRRLNDLLRMSEPEWDQIIDSYDLGANRSRYYHGSLGDSFSDGGMFTGSKSDRLRNLIALLEFLGAHQIVEHLRRRGGTMRR